MDPELITEAPATEAPAEELSIEAEALAAMDAGLEAETAEAPAPVAEPQAEPIPGTAEALAAETAKTEAAKTEPPAKDEATEAEIAALGLKEGKTADRFRTMAGEIKALAPIREALTKAGITDPAQLPTIVQHASDYKELIGMVQDTGATPVQYGQALDYLKIVNKANQGDRAAAEQAYAVMQGEMAELAKMLGKEVPGVHDPLAAHADLLQELEDGDITRARALEIAQQRTALAMDTGRRQADEGQRTQQAEAQQGVQALNQLGNTLQSADPDYERKVPFLLPTLEIIKRTLPPSQWVQATQEAYRKIPALPAAAPAPAPAAKPTPGPVRSGLLRPALQPTSDDPMEALNFGIAAANG